MRKGNNMENCITMVNSNGAILFYIVRKLN